MRTEVATEVQQLILEVAARHMDTARMYAVAYAEGDDAADKARYWHYKFAADEIKKLHTPLCQALHALEAKIPVEAKP